MASRILVKEKRGDFYRAYNFDVDFPAQTLEKLGRELFSDPVSEDFYVNKLPEEGVFREMHFLPGVKDTVAETAKDAIAELLGDDALQGVAVSSSFIVWGDDYRLPVHPNPILHGVRTLQSPEDIYIPKLTLPNKGRVHTFRTDLSEKTLLKISKERLLALNGEEMTSIMEYFKRNDVKEERAGVGLASPTDCELEILAQTWSEHCKHKIFNAEITYRENGSVQAIDSIFNTFIKGSTRRLQERNQWIVSTLWDNAGVVRFNDHLNIMLKGETHNTPSGLDPYGGAITGIVGVYRDILGAGIGGELLMGLYGYTLPENSGNFNPNIEPALMLEEIVRGVKDGGNKSGVPTLYGVTFFDQGFLGKPGVYVAAIGKMPAFINGKPSHEKHIDIGDFVVVMGGRTGADGIHGATFSSEGLKESSPISAVQIGDPFTQKKLMDFMIEVRNKGLYNFVTDNGAGGISSSVGESAKYCGQKGGVEINLDSLLTKYHNLAPWQLLVSESQERMTFAVNPSKINEFMDLAVKHGVEGSVIGTYVDSGKFHATHKGKTVAYIDMEFLHNGNPRMKLDAEWINPVHDEPAVKVRDYSSLLADILARPNVRSQEWITRQYDHEVQGLSVIKHLVGFDGPSDAIINRVEHGNNEGLIVSMGFNPLQSKIDTYHMAANAMNEAIQRSIAVGGNLDMIWLNDNFCWPNPVFNETSNPDGKYKLAQLIRANQALHDYSLAFNAPCISGKDSMSMDGIMKDMSGNSVKVSALPSLLFTLNSKMPDVINAISMDVKVPGDLVYVIGETRNELGASELYDLEGFTGNNVPKVNAEEMIDRYARHAEAASRGLIASSHGLYRGGLAVALAEAAFAGNLGMEISLENILRSADVGDDAALFSETAGRFVVTINPEYKEEFERVMGNHASLVGYVRSDDAFIVKGLDKSTIIDANIFDLKKAWRGDIPQGNTDTLDVVVENVDKLINLDLTKTSVKGAVLYGYGINCDVESEYALNLAGASADRIHINDLIGGQINLSDYQILVLPGGFSFGDDIGSGKVFANKLKVLAKGQIENYIDSGKIVIGICNGAQIGIKYNMAFSDNDGQQATLTYNDSGNFECRWVNLKEYNQSIFTKGIEDFPVPIAHGEGKFVTSDSGLGQYLIYGMEQVKLQYDGLDYPRNPNGSEDGIAAITNERGNVMLLMPHPERYLYFENHPLWTRVKESLLRSGEQIPSFGMGLFFFRNAVEYAERNLL